VRRRHSVRIQRPMARVLLPLPDRDFDVTEVAVPWKVLRDAGHEVVIATEHGASAPCCDPLLLTGVVFGQLGAEAEPKAFYEELRQDGGFRNPRAWATLQAADFDAMVLPGGHAPGMKQYLASTLQAFVATFAASGKPWGAICHGAVLAARAKTAAGKSALFGRKSTCLPKYMERTAYFLTAWKLGTYYRTYPQYVEDEVRAALAAPTDFVRGPRTLTARGTRSDHSAAFVVEDGAYVSARWPGDAYLFAERLLSRI
jgi:putative intracellular protease/amidase